MSDDRPPEPAADGGLLQLVFSSEYLPGFDKPTVRLAIERALRLDAAHSAHLFSGQRVVLRQGLTAAAAARHVEQFARLGARLRMEPDAGPPDPPVRPAIVAAPAPRWRRRVVAVSIVVAAAGWLALQLRAQA